MAKIQVSERIIREKFQTLEKKDNTSLYHNESELFYNDGLVYKIFKPYFRINKEKNCYLLENKKFPYANNIIDLLYQGDKLIGVTYEYLENFKTLKNNFGTLNLYEIKKIMHYLINFYEKIINNNLIYWDNHLNNIGFSKNNFYIVDIDSIEKIKYEQQINYALNGLLTLFYEMYYKKSIRSEYDNYRGIIHLISENDYYLKCELTLKEIKKIINDTSEDYLESKKHILKL